MAGLYDYGFPSDQALIQQALGLARAGVPTRRGIRREYGRAIGDVSGFTKALIGLLRQDDIGGAYTKPLAEEQSARAAAAARLGALGPEYAGADIAAGAAGESGLSLLRANQGAASAYGRKQPGIAGARGALGILGLVNARTDALSKRREDIGSNFAQALQQARSAALQQASTNADIDQRQQSLDLDALAAAAQLQGKGGEKKSLWHSTRADVFDQAEALAEKMVTVSGNYGEKSSKPAYTFSKAYRRLWRRYGTDLVDQGFSRTRVRKMLRDALRSAGFKPPRKPTSPSGVAEGIGGLFSC
jgi:hypothetical protein